MGQLVSAGRAPPEPRGPRPEANLGKGFQPGFKGTRQGELTATGRSQITEGACIP